MRVNLFFRALLPVMCFALTGGTFASLEPLIDGRGINPGEPERFLLVAVDENNVLAEIDGTPQILFLECNTQSCEVNLCLDTGCAGVTRRETIRVISLTGDGSGIFAQSRDRLLVERQLPNGFPYEYAMFVTSPGFLRWIGFPEPSDQVFAETLRSAGINGLPFPGAFAFFDLTSLESAAMAAVSHDEFSSEQLYRVVATREESLALEGELAGSAASGLADLPARHRAALDALLDQNEIPPPQSRAFLSIIMIHLAETCHLPADPEERQQVRGTALLVVQYMIVTDTLDFGAAQLEAAEYFDRGALTCSNAGTLADRVVRAFRDHATAFAG